MAAFGNVFIGISGAVGSICCGYKLTVAVDVVACHYGYRGCIGDVVEHQHPHVTRYIMYGKILRPFGNINLVFRPFGGNFEGISAFRCLECSGFARRVGEENLKFLHTISHVIGAGEQTDCLGLARELF